MNHSSFSQLPRSRRRSVSAATAAALAVAAILPGAGPVAAQDASAAAGTGRFCEGMNITFFPGGTPGGGFETVVYNGAQAAENLFGPNVSYQWSDWDSTTMITQFQQAVATAPDGIAIMGHPGD